MCVPQARRLVPACDRRASSSLGKARCQAQYEEETVWSSAAWHGGAGEYVPHPRLTLTFESPASEMERARWSVKLVRVESFTYGYATHDTRKRKSPHTSVA